MNINSDITMVTNKCTGQIQLYALPPRQAVVEAYVQNTPAEARARHQPLSVFKDGVITCGDWSAKCEQHPGLPSPTDPVHNDT